MTDYKVIQYTNSLHLIPVIEELTNSCSGGGNNEVTGIIRHAFIWNNI